jgi:hypothetical protein
MPSPPRARDARGPSRAHGGTRPTRTRRPGARFPRRRARRRRRDRRRSPTRPRRRWPHVHPAVRPDRRDADDRPVLRPALELHEAPTGGRLRDPDLREDLVGRERRFEQGGEEVAGRDRPGPTRSLRDELGVERQQDGRHVAGRVTVRDRSADRAHVADLRIADLTRRVCDDRAELLERFGVRDVVMPRERPDRDPVAVLADVGQVGEPADVHERRGPRHPQLHRRKQRVAAGEELGVLARAEQRDRLVDGSCPLVVERRRDHRGPPFARWIVRQTFSGVAGRGIAVTPR